MQHVFVLYLIQTIFLQPLLLNSDQFDCCWLGIIWADLYMNAFANYLVVEGMHIYIQLTIMPSIHTWKSGAHLIDI